MNKNKKYYISIPKISGYVFQAQNRLYLHIFGAFFIFTLLFVTNLPVAERVLYIALSIVLLSFEVNKILRQPKEVYLTYNSVEAKYHSGKTVAKPLDKYCIYIDEARSLVGSFNAYCYRVSLLSTFRNEKNVEVKDIYSDVGEQILHRDTKINLGYKAISLKGGAVFLDRLDVKNNRIILCNRLFVAENLKDYVLNIKNSLEPDIPIIFSSERLLEDYRGV